MIQIEKIFKSYGGRELFSNASFPIEKRERCAIVGRNGSGKSTLLKIIAGLEEVDAGEIRLPKGSRIGTLPQHLHFKEPSLLEEGILGLPEEQREESYRVEKILSGLGFSEKEFSLPPMSFSGGYQLRLALCKVLVGEPDLLLLDEPTNYLDIVAIRWLELYLRSWRGQILFISHDQSFVNRVCTHIIGIHRCAIEKVKGDLAKYHETLLLREETHERTRQKNEKKKAHMQTFVDRFGAKATKAAQARSRQKAIDKIDSLASLQEETSLSFSFREKEFPGKQMLRLENIAFSYDAKPLIHDLNVSIEKGERIAIIGKNGRGKSTVLQILSGALSSSQGRMSLNDNLSTAYFGQTNIDRLERSHTIEEEVMNSSPTSTYSEVRNACGVMLFSGDDAKKRISILSGGERSRVLLAKILLTPANLLLLDEPSHHLDIESIEALIEAIHRFSGAIVLVSHDELILRKFHADKMIVCKTGRQELFLGNYDSFLEKCGWEEGEMVMNKEKEKISNKEQRQQRAQGVQQRAQELRPIKHEIQKLEKNLEKIEQERASLEQKMIDTLQEGGSSMQELTFKHGKIEKEQLSLYQKLEELLVQEESIKKKYE